MSEKQTPLHREGENRQPPRVSGRYSVALSSLIGVVRVVCFNLQRHVWEALKFLPGKPTLMKEAAETTGQPGAGGGSSLWGESRRPRYPLSSGGAYRGCAGPLTPPRVPGAAALPTVLPPRAPPRVETASPPPQNGLRTASPKAVLQKFLVRVRRERAGPWR